MGDFKEILNQAKKEIVEITVQDVQEKFNPANGLLFSTFGKATSGNRATLTRLFSFPGASWKSRPIKL